MNNSVRNIFDKDAYRQEANEQFKLLKQEMEKTGKTAVETAHSIGITNEAVWHCAKNSKGAKLEQSMLNESLEATGMASKATAIGVGLLNAALKAGLIWAVTAAIGALYKFANTTEECKKRVNELVSEFESENSTIRQHSETISKISERYEELSHGVDELGDNVSLTTEEYEEYNDIANQIADMFPTMVQGWTDEGNAILNLKGNVEELNKALLEEKKLNAAKLINSDDVMKNYKNTYQTGFSTVTKTYWSNPFGLSEEREAENLAAQEKIKKYKEFLKLSYEEIKTLSEEIGNDTTTRIQRGLLSMLGVDKDLTEEEFEAFRADLTAQIATLQSEIDEALSAVKSKAGAYLLYNENYSSLTTDEINIISSLLNNIDEEIANSFGDKDENISKYVNEIVDIIHSSEPEVQKAFTKWFTLSGDLGITEKVDILDSIIQIYEDRGLTIPVYFEEQKEDLNKLEEQYKAAINRFKNDDSKTDLGLQYSQAVENRKKKYAGKNYVGNVDINNRPVVINDDGSYSTTSTAFQERKMADGSYEVIHYTPILPDGTVLTGKALDNYISKILKASDVLAVDNPENGGYGIVYKVDTEVNGEKITDDNLDKAFGMASAWDIGEHNRQDSMYKDEAELKAAIEKFKEEDSSKILEDFFAENSIDTTEEIEYWNKITEGAKNATEAIEKYNKTKIIPKQRSNWSEFTEDESEKIDDFQSKMQTLGDALSSIRNGDDIDFTDLLQEFPELQGQSGNLEQAITNLINGSWQELQDELGTGLPDDAKQDLQDFVDELTGVAPNLEDAFASVQNSYSVLQEFKEAMNDKGLTDSVLSSVAGLSAELNELVAGFYAGTVSAEQLYAALQNHYNTDLQNYATAIGIKNQYSTDFYNSVILADTELVNKFADNYNIDLRNFKDLAEAKAEVESKLLHTLGEWWSQYYDIQSQTFTADANILFKEAQNAKAAGVSDKDNDFLTNYNLLKERVAAYENAINAIDNTVFEKVGADFEKISDQIAKNSESGADKTKDAFYGVVDWMEKKLEKIEKLATKTIDKIADSLQYALDNNFVKKAFNQLNDQMKQNAYMAKRYQKSANAVGLSQDWIDKIEGGAKIDYDHIHDEALANKIAEYEDWYNKSIEASEATEQLRDSVKELAEAMANAPIEKFAKKIETYATSTDLLDAKIENATTAKEKNKLINKQINNINKTESAYEKAEKQTTKNVNSTSKKVTNQKVAKNATDKQKKIFKDLKAKVKARVKAGKEIGDKLLDKIYNYCKSVGNFNWYQDCEAYNAALLADTQAEDDLNLYRETAKQEKADKALQKFENIANERDKMIKNRENNKTSIDNQMALAEARGEKITTAYYKGLMTEQEGINNELALKAQELQQNLNDAVASGAVEVGSEQWYSMVEAITAVNQELADGLVTLREYSNSMREIRWNAHNAAMENVDRKISEAEFYIDLLSSKDLTDDNGLTDEGYATLALQKSNYDTYIAKAKADKAEYDQLMADIVSGKESATDEKVIARQKELEDSIRNNISAADDAEQAMKDLAKNGYDALLESMSELINKYKEWLDAQKDAYEYQRNIEDKVKNISTLQKQLDVYSGNDTEEAKAKVQQLKVELEEAQKDLESTQYDKYISDTNTMLDDLYEGIENFFDEKLDEVVDRLDEIINGSNTDVPKVLEKTTTELTEDDTVIDVSSDLKNIVTGTTTAEDFVNKNVAEEDKKVEDAQKQAEEKANVEKQKAELNSKIAAKIAQHSQLMKEIQSLENELNSTRPGNISKVLEILESLSKKSNEANSVLLELEDLDKQLANLPQYATGSKHIKENQLAWTQEKGTEGIYRSSDGAILTPLNSGDMVFTNDMMKTLWEVAQGNMPMLNASIPSFNGNIVNKGIGDVNTNIELNITLPNVQNYDEFKSALVGDKSFEKAIQSMTVDRILGGNSLSKNKFI